MARRLPALIVCALMTLAACGKGSPPAATTAPAPSTSAGASSVPAGSAHISITSPKDRDTIKASEAKVVTEVQGFNLVDKIGKPAVQGEGHIIYYAGAGYEIPVTPGQPAMAGGSGSFTSFPSAKSSYTWPAPQPGLQTFTVQLVNNDNTPLDPPQSAQVTVTVSS